MKPILTTPRLTLREMSLDDLDFLADLLAHPEVTRYYPKQYTRDEAVQWIERILARYEQQGVGLWLVSDKAAGHPVGQVGLMRREVDGEPLYEVGYLIHYPFWRNHYASEAATGCLDYAYTKLDQQRVIALIRPENLPSQGVARKIGMQQVSRTVHADMEHLIFARDRG